MGFGFAVTLAETSMVSKTDRAASVAVVFEDTDPAANQARWKGNIDFVLESGAWRIDSMKGLYPSSGRPIHDTDEVKSAAGPSPTTPGPAAPTSPSITIDLAVAANLPRSPTPGSTKHAWNCKKD